MIRVPQGQVLYRPGDIDLTVYMIMYGTLKLYKPPTGIDPSTDYKSFEEATLHNELGCYKIGTLVGEEWIYY